jgi:hypothetical protein
MTLYMLLLFNKFTSKINNQLRSLEKYKLYRVEKNNQHYLPCYDFEDHLNNNWS